MNNPGIGLRKQDADTLAYRQQIQEREEAGLKYAAQLVRKFLGQTESASQKTLADKLGVFPSVMSRLAAGGAKGAVELTLEKWAILARESGTSWGEILEALGIPLSEVVGSRATLAADLDAYAKGATKPAQQKVRAEMANYVLERLQAPPITTSRLDAHLLSVAQRMDDGAKADWLRQGRALWAGRRSAARDTNPETGKPMGFGRCTLCRAVDASVQAAAGGLCYECRREEGQHTLIGGRL